MKVEYLNEKLKKQCSGSKEAAKIFGGDKRLAISLLSRINALENADTLKDIVIQRQFRFHNLHKKDHKDFNGCFAIDVKTIRDSWRIILEPLNADGEPFKPCNIDEIAAITKRVRIREVSKHYE